LKVVAVPAESEEAEVKLSVAECLEDLILVQSTREQRLSVLGQACRLTAARQPGDERRAWSSTPTPPPHRGAHPKTELTASELSQFVDALMLKGGLSGDVQVPPPPSPWIPPFCGGPSRNLTDF
jgi:hypothetical protein